jgi:TRAP-type mannitol/chloroaromatic compound transport system substrate-binding protein
MRLLCVALVLLGAVSCGGAGAIDADELRSCVRKELPPGAVDRVVSSTEQGVTSINYYHRGAETDVSVFASADDAISAEKAEARLGDAHDRRIANVLYSGGGAVEAAVVRCAK